MGKWNSRRHTWMPRKKHYQDAPESYYTYPELSGDCQSNIPTWEKQFCLSVGSVPWAKVVAAKYHMRYHGDVMKWDDSAGEEAFNHAKERYWAAVNGLPCPSPLPDPDMYIDDVDWNSTVDPELIADLDREYFNPDGGDETKKFKVPGNLNNCGNPWECSDLKGTEALKNEAEGWDHWGWTINKSSNLDHVQNPWEPKITAGSGPVKEEDAWGTGGDKSRGWSRGKRCNENFWNCDYQNVVPVNKRSWRDPENKPWGWKQQETSSARFGSGGENNRGWTNWNQNAELRNYDPRGGGTWGVMNGGCRKREGPHRYSSSYKRSRFHADDYGTGQNWRKAGRN